MGHQFMIKDFSFVVEFFSAVVIFFGLVWVVDFILYREKIVNREFY